MITWDWRTMGRTAIQVTQPRTKDNTFTRKNKKRAKTDIFFQNMPHYKAGYWTSWQCVVKVWPQTSDGILNTLRHCLASYPLILILTDFHVHCNKMLLSFERGFIFLVYCFIAESIAPVNVPPSSLHSPLGHPKVELQKVYRFYVKLINTKVIRDKGWLE